MNTLTQQTLLFLSLPRHDEKYTSTPWQIANELSYDNRIIWVDHPFTFIELLRNFFSPSIRIRRAAYGKRNSLVIKNINVILAPFIWPINFLPRGPLYNYFSRRNQAILSKRINKYLRTNNIKSLIYVNSFDFYFPDLQRSLDTKVKLNVYHCIDPMVKAFTLRHGLYLEQRAARQANIVISTAPALQKRFTARGFKKSYCVPNAASYTLFARANDLITKTHPKLASIKGNVLGFLGNIERRTDFNLLLKVIDQLPDWNLVMAGPLELKYVPDELIDHPRVHFLGAIPYQEAPAMMKGFTVAMIPFICDEVSSGIYPLKLYEYLAAGRPVVVTRFNPEVLNELSDVIEIADTADDFAEAVIRQAATDSREKVKARMKIASQNTWHERADLFGKLIANELKRPVAHVTER